jgi:hypothetical protein
MASGASVYPCENPLRENIRLRQTRDLLLPRLVGVKLVSTNKHQLNGWGMAGIRCDTA